MVQVSLHPPTFLVTKVVFKAPTTAFMAKLVDREVMVVIFRPHPPGVLFNVKFASNKDDAVNCYHRFDQNFQPYPVPPISPYNNPYLNHPPTSHHQGLLQTLLQQ